MKETPFMQMFLCLVNLGRYKAFQKHDQSLRVPPLIEGSTTKRYDSVYNKPAKHFIVYDNSKAYPAYLITYRVPGSDAKFISGA